MTDELPGDDQAARVGNAVLEGLRRADQQQLALLIGRAFVAAGAPGLSSSAPGQPAPLPAPAPSAVPFIPPASIPTPIKSLTNPGAQTFSEPPLLLMSSEPPPEEGQRSEIRLPVVGPPPTPAVEIVGDRYQLVVANGGDRRGRIFIGRDRNDGAEVTVRIFSLRMGHDAASLARLEDRVARCQHLSHPHLERLYAAGLYNGELYSVAEMVRGKPLSDLLANGPMPENQALRLLLQAARALQHAWDQGRIVHGDLDTDLLVVRTGGSEPALVVTGMGMPRTPWDDASRIGPLTVPWYVAPERLRGEPDEDPTSDMYALGAILFHLIAGAPAFQGGAAEVRAGHLGPLVPEVSRRRAGISPATQQFLQAALSKTPGQRFASYNGFISGITKALVGIGGFSADLVDPGMKRSGGTSRTYRKHDSGQQDAQLAPTVSGTGTDRFRRDSSPGLPANPPAPPGTGTDRFRRDANAVLPNLPSGLPLGHPAAAVPASATERIRRDSHGRPVNTTSGLTQKPPSDRIVRPGGSSPANPAPPATDGAPPAPRPGTSRIGRISSAQWQPGQPHIQGQIPADARPRTDRVAKDATRPNPEARASTTDALLPRNPGAASAAGASAPGASPGNSGTGVFTTGTGRIVRTDGGPPKPAPTIANPYPSDGGIMSSRISRRETHTNTGLLTPVPQALPNAATTSGPLIPALPVSGNAAASAPSAAPGTGLVHRSGAAVPAGPTAAAASSPSSAPAPAASSAPVAALTPTAAPALPPAAPAAPGKDDEARPSTDAVAKLGDPALDRRRPRSAMPSPTVYTSPVTPMMKLMMWAPVVVLVLCVLLLIVLTVLSANR